MAQTSPAVAATAPSVAAQRNRLLAVLLVIPILVAVCTGWVFSRREVNKQLFSLTNLVGPTTQSLLRGDGLTACTEAMGTPGNPICFHAARMPLPSVVLALGIKLLGNRYLPVALFKALLLLLPVELALYLVWTRIPFGSQLRRMAICLLLLAPFAIPAFLACVVNLQVEEGYTYSLLALALAILLFGMGRLRAEPLLFAATLDGLYLAKSAMAPAVAVLLIGYLLMERRAARRLLVAALVVAAPVGWAVYQYHSSGRYSIGTSLDGMNLHKGNNTSFLEHYPPAPGNSLDSSDPSLNRGLHFNDEWSFNDYHLHAALGYLRHHPRATAVGDWRKLDVLLFSVDKVGSTRLRGAEQMWEIAGLVLFRLMLWVAIIYAAYAAFRPAKSAALPQHWIGWIFLALTAACIFPYVAGFAYTRHVSVLIYPAALMCCRMLTGSRNTKVGHGMLTG